VGAEIKNSLLIGRLLITLTDLLYGEHFDELGDSVDKLAGFDGSIEALFREIAETDQTVNQN